MCGRTACTLAPDEVCRASSYRDRGGRRRQPRWRDGDAEKYKPSYNRSPQSMSPVLLSQQHFNKDAPVDERVLAVMRWGLVPAWFKQDNPSKMHYNTSNCRSENIREKKTYKYPMNKGQRCVILADGFYEWKRQEKRKQPFFIYFPQSSSGSSDPATSKKSPAAEMVSQDLTEEGEDVSEWTGWRLLTMAGLFDCWTPPEGGEPLYTYTVITVDASPNLQDIHGRMPAVLDGEEEVRRWLNFGQVKSQDALKLLQSKNILTFHPVSSLVNNSCNNSPECLQPVDLNSKKEPKSTGSSKMMMNWLKNGAPSKRKKPNEDDQETKSASPKSTAVQGGSKKPRTH